ncbi:MAG: mechanosensitive ion channel family protein [Acidobacteria bacterium]|nr:MAG: mechanosensitive ion channel family protein [Acidobacteriota bacterium]
MSKLIGLAQEVEEPTEIVVETTEACAGLGPLCNLLADWTGNEAFAETISWLLGTPAKIIIITVLALILNRLARRLINRLSDRLGVVTADTHIVSERSRERAEERADTIGSLLRSLASVVIFSISLIIILATFGIAVVPAIASAGVLAIAIGFGAQSIVEDLLRGVFMLAEDQFGVGDRVDVGTVNGYVERVTLRTMVIRDSDGVLWHMPNSEINYVANESQESSRAVVEIAIPYGSDMRGAMKILQHAADLACSDSEWSDIVKGPAEVRGIQQLGDHEVMVRVQVWVAPGSKRPFQRHLRLYLQEGLDEAGLGNSPKPSIDVWLKGAPEQPAHAG